MASFAWSAFCLAVAWLPLVLPAPPAPSNNTETSLCGLLKTTDSNITKEGDDILILPSDSCYKANDEVKVFILVNSTNPYIEHFIAMARIENSGVWNTAHSVGGFNVTSDPRLETSTCFDNNVTVVSNRNGTLGNCTSFVWKAPSNVTADIVFQAKLFANKTSWRRSVVSPVLAYNANCSSNHIKLSCKVGTGKKESFFGVDAASKTYGPISAWTALFVSVLLLV